METPPYNTAWALATINPPSVDVPHNEDAPVEKISAEDLRALGQRFNTLFMQYVSDRRIAELRWLANQRQYLGIYDPEVEKEMSPNRSKAYPKITRVKCISVLSRIMNLMFQGNERNWEIKSAPWPDITSDEVRQALQEAQSKDQEAGTQPPSPMTREYFMQAIKNYAQGRAQTLSDLIDDQLQELGGSQSTDYVSLNRSVVRSGIIYGIGVLRGPFARKSTSVVWDMDGPAPVPKKREVFKPHFEFLSVWDFYPDMSAKTLRGMDGYFVRHVMTRSQIKKLAKKPDFFENVINDYLNRNSMGNYRAQPHEMELRAMGVKVNVNEMKSETMKYEILAWHGSVDGHLLQSVGVQVPPEKLSDDLDSEIWMIDANVICARLNPWKEMDVDIDMIHTFLFDEDDTSPIGFGLPSAIRDSQMMVSGATRMLMDNASVVCGPQLELNTDLLRLDQDFTAIGAYKVWYREGEGQDAQWPAVKNVQIDAHIDSLLKIVELGQKFADSETFVGPATGGDMDKGPSEPFRTAAGASMLKGDAALPFKDIIRAFDTFTQSVIHACVVFNRTFNPALAPDGDYDVIARGATSLMAKELRGMQADSLAQTLKPEEMMHVDERKLVEARVRARDMEDILVSPDEASRRQQQADQQTQAQQDQAQRIAEATIRKTLADAFKGITQGQKNTAAADAQMVDAAMDILERGMRNEIISGGTAPGAQPGNGAAPIPAAGQGQQPGSNGDDALAQSPAGGAPGPIG
jgi:hypothetical protein